MNWSHQVTINTQEKFSHIRKVLKWNRCTAKLCGETIYGVLCTSIRQVSQTTKATGLIIFARYTWRKEVHVTIPEQGKVKWPEENYGNTDLFSPVSEHTNQWFLALAHTKLQVFSVELRDPQSWQVCVKTYCDLLGQHRAKTSFCWETSTPWIWDHQA